MDLVGWGEGHLQLGGWIWSGGGRVIYNWEKVSGWIWSGGGRVVYNWEKVSGWIWLGGGRVIYNWKKVRYGWVGE